MNEDKSNKLPFFGGLLAGVVSGVVLARYWRGLAKEGIKTGIRAGRKIKEISQQAMEDLEDVAAEATEELSQEDQKRS
jgi:hypothetical protein